MTVTLSRRRSTTAAASRVGGTTDGPEVGAAKRVLQIGHDQCGPWFKVRSVVGMEGPGHARRVSRACRAASSSLSRPQVDQDAAAHRARVSAAKLANCRRLADRIAAEGLLSESWTPATAADMIYALSTSDVVEGLTVDRRWSRRRFAERLSALLRATFLTTGR